MWADLWGTTRKPAVTRGGAHKLGRPIGTWPTTRRQSIQFAAQASPASWSPYLGSDEPAQDRNNFFKTQIIFWGLAAIDGHGKNFSIALLPGGRYRATPIYDVLSAHPVILKGKNQIPSHKAKLAMAARGSTNYYLINQILRRHWIAQAQQVGLGAVTAEQLIEEVVESVESVIGQVSRLLPKDFPMNIADAIFSGMRKQSEKLATAV